MHINNSLFFGSKIDFVDKEKFENLRRKAREAGESWDIDTACTGPELFSADASVCTVGGFNDGRNAFMFHLLPSRTLENEKNIEEVFRKKKNSLGRRTDGLITGGSVRGDYAYYKDAYQVILNLFQSLKINPSIIWGSLGAGTNLHYSAKTDTWSIYSYNVESLDDLKKNYEIVNIAPNDELFIRGKKVN